MLNSNSIGVGIVGARRCTEYGKSIAKETGEFLAKNNIAVISGMAKGVDGYAHTACINAGGYTIAVLGCGVDICYPKEHANCGREMNREILAVPNNIYSIESKGCNQLIHNGAKIYINSNQLLDGMEEFKINNNEIKTQKEYTEKEISNVKLDKSEQNILDMITKALAL